MMGETQALILTGGRGSRLGKLVGRANKPMVRIGGRPFLEFLLRQLRRHGLRRIVMCTGYRAEVIERYFGDGERLGMTIRYSRESVPLGTGGALKLAEPLIDSDPFLVFNGDSIVDADLGALLEHHRRRAALLTLALVKVPEAGRYGAVVTNDDGGIVSFVEKKSAGPALVNAGVYCCGGDVLDHIPAAAPCSLERDVLSSLPASGVHGFAVDGYFIDIGIPDTLREVRDEPDRLRAAAGDVTRC